MKKITLLFLSTIMYTLTFAQDEIKEIASSSAGILAPTTEEKEKAWQFGGGFGIYGSQVQLVNWAAGGLSSISGSVMGDVFANYRKGKHSWESSFRGEWGMVKNEDAPLTKNKDMMELNSKYGYQVDKKGKVFVGALLNFTSQFTQGIKDDEVNYSSNFMAPGRLTMAAGLDWKPSPMFSLFFSPAAGKFTFVTDKGIDETTYGLDAGKIVRMEFGAFLKADFKKEIMKNITFKTSLALFNNFLDNTTYDKYDEDGNFVKAVSNRGNIDVDWITGLDLTVNKWITVNLATQLIYDHDVEITRENADGNMVTGPTTQFSQALNVGFTYRFDPEARDAAKAKRDAKKAAKAAVQ